MTDNCIYCGVELNVDEQQVIPAIDDSAAWEELAKLHNTGCEWIETKAHRTRNQS